MKGIRRTKGTAPVQKAAALTDDIRAMIDATDAGLIGSRDRALILLGFAGAFRRSELVGLDVDDCAFGKDGLTVTLRRSKTDQEGAGRKVGIPYGSNPETCPVRTMQAWIGTGAPSERAAVPLHQSPRASTAGPVERHRRGAHRKEAGGTRGLDPCQVRRAFATGRARHHSGHCGRIGAVHHESDRAPQSFRWYGATSGTGACSGRIAQLGL
jgi:integrase